MIGHVAPEAARGGPIALVHDGDIIELDLVKKTITLEVPEDELQRRKAEWKKPKPHYTEGVFAKYCALVSSAAEGAITFAPNLD